MNKFAAYDRIEVLSRDHFIISPFYYKYIHCNFKDTAEP